MKKIFVFLCILTIAVFLQISNRLIVRAWQDNDGKYIICHCVKEHCETLHLPLTGANNHLKNHSRDHEDACREEPTVTPTNTPSPTPTEQPIASPSATLAPTKEPEHNSDSYSDPQPDGSMSNPTCDTPKPGNVDNLSYDGGIQGDHIITLNWSLPLRAHTVNICYGRHEGVCEYGASNIPNSGSYDVKSLENNQSYWFSIQGQDGCATGNWSKWIDPIP